MFEPHYTAGTNGGRVLQPANQPVTIKLIAGIPEVRAFARPEMFDRGVCRFSECMTGCALCRQFRTGRLRACTLRFDSGWPDGESECRGSRKSGKYDWNLHE